MTGPTVDAAGRYLRVADPDWANPLDGSFARERGGRWNEPGSFAVVYLNASPRTARLNCLHRFAGLPYGPEDLDEGQAPVLVATDVPAGEHADCRSDRGLEGWGLPVGYPLHPDGRPVTWQECRAVGHAAAADGLDGVACRSAAGGARPDDHELAYFERDRQLEPVERIPFGEWFWTS